MTDLPDDRRGSMRFGLPARATVVRRREDERIPFAVRDLSAGGARLVGHVRLAEYERIRVELELGDVSFTLPAEVVRTDPQNAQVAIVFRDVPREAIAAIEAAIGAMIERVRAASSPLVLVLCAPEEIGATLARDLAQLGRDTKACTSMLDLVSALQDRAARHEAVIIHGDAVGRPELLQLLAEHHPKLRRVLLFGDQLGSIDHASSSRVDAVLRTPWRIRPLSRALGIQSADSTAAMLPAAIDEEHEP